MARAASARAVSVDVDHCCISATSVRPRSDIAFCGSAVTRGSSEREGDDSKAGFWLSTAMRGGSDREGDDDRGGF
jgi:hypothetical protein